MTPIVALIIGLLIGWLIEWVIDWVYWRRRVTAAEENGKAACRSQVTALENELASYKSQLADLQATTSALQSMPAHTAAAPEPTRQQVITVERTRDNLEIINGIGPVIARLLNNAGIYTFGDLAALSQAELREIVGTRIQQLADEEDILEQARQLADRQG